RGGYILKWSVHITEPVRQFIQTVEEVLDSAGTTRFYGAHGDTRLITALQGITQVNTEPYLRRTRFPQHLFVARQVVVSRIIGPEKYDILARFDLAGVDEMGRGSYTRLD
ncbi:MAG: hypothetical protein L0322_30235, partial [Chloroflexi bacterium]|nr:hypothetical protein [Chloroflexota bacterium]